TKLVPDVPQYLTDAINRAMAIDSDGRFASVEEFWQALNVHPGENEAPPAPVMAPAPVPRLHHVGDAGIPNMPNDPAAVNSRQKNIHPYRNRGVLISLSIFIALFALLAGIVLGNIANSSHNAAKITPGPAQNATTTSAGSRTTPTPAVTSTPVPTHTPV